MKNARGMKEDFDKFKAEMMASGNYDDDSELNELDLYQRFLEKKAAEEEELRK